MAYVRQPTTRVRPFLTGKSKEQELPTKETLRQLGQRIITAEPDTYKRVQGALRGANPSLLSRIFDTIDKPRQAVFKTLFGKKYGKEVVTGIDNKFLRGVAGFALDVVLDPVTWVSLGAAGAGKTVIKTALTGKIERAVGREVAEKVVVPAIRKTISGQTKKIPATLSMMQKRVGQLPVEERAAITALLKPIERGGVGLAVPLTRARTVLVPGTITSRITAPITEHILSKVPGLTTLLESISPGRHMAQAGLAGIIAKRAEDTFRTGIATDKTGVQTQLVDLMQSGFGTEEGKSVLLDLLSGTRKIDELGPKMAQQFEGLRTELNNINKSLDAAGIDIGYLTDYMPFVLGEGGMLARFGKGRPIGRRGYNQGRDTIRWAQRELPFKDVREANKFMKAETQIDNFFEQDPIKFLQNYMVGAKRKLRELDFHDTLVKEGALFDTFDITAHGLTVEPLKQVGFTNADDALRAAVTGEARAELDRLKDLFPEDHVRLLNAAEVVKKEISVRQNKAIYQAEVGLTSRRATADRALARLVGQDRTAGAQWARTQVIADRAVALEQQLKNTTRQLFELRGKKKVAEVTRRQFLREQVKALRQQLRVAKSEFKDASNFLYEDRAAFQKAGEAFSKRSEEVILQQTKLADVRSGLPLRGIKKTDPVAGELLKLQREMEKAETRLASLLKRKDPSKPSSLARLVGDREAAARSMQKAVTNFNERKAAVEDLFGKVADGGTPWPVPKETVDSFKTLAKQKDYAELGFRPLQGTSLPVLNGKWVPLEVATEWEAKFAPRNVTKIIENLDKGIAVFKTYVTIPFPGFHMRNLLGGEINNFSGGVRTVNKSDFWNIWFNKEPARVFSRYGNKTSAQLRQELMDQGIVQQVNIASDVLSDLPPGRTPITRLIRKKGRGAMNTVENHLRGSAYLSGLEQFGDSTTARQFVIVRHGDYTDLLPTEINLRRLMPFYKWMRMNLPFQLNTFLEVPGKQTKVQHFINNLLQDREKRAEFEKSGFISEFLEQRGGFLASGPLAPGFLKTKPTFVSPDLPVSDINVLGQPLKGIAEQTLVGGLLEATFGQRLRGGELRHAPIPVQFAPLRALEKAPVFSQFFSRAAGGELLIDQRLLRSLSVLPTTRFQSLLGQLIPTPSVPGKPAPLAEVPVLQRVGTSLVGVRTSPEGQLGQQLAAFRAEGELEDIIKDLYRRGFGEQFKATKEGKREKVITRPRRGRPRRKKR